MTITDKKLYGEAVLELIEKAVGLAENLFCYDKSLISRSRDSLGINIFNKEFKTIKIGVPRGCGKTWAINKFLQKNYNTILTSPSSRITKMALGFNKHRVLDISTLRGATIDHDDYLIIDEASNVDLNIMERIYDTFKGKFIILIG